MPFYLQGRGANSSLFSLLKAAAVSLHANVVGMMLPQLICSVISRRALLA